MLRFFKSLLGGGQPPSRRAEPIAARLKPTSASPKEPYKQLVDEQAASGFEIQEPLAVKHDRKLERLPDGFRAPGLTYEGTALTGLPDQMQVQRVYIKCEALETIGSGVKARTLRLEGAKIEALPSDIDVDQRLELINCRQLQELPAGLSVGSLVVHGCSSLKALPDGLDVAFLDVQDCVSLQHIPEGLRVRHGHLTLRDCAWLTRLPDNIGTVSGLDVSGCLNLTQLPQGLNITSWIDFSGTGITQLADGFDHVGLRWRGIPVSRRIVFEPETLTPEEILNERNAEMRRVMVERFGYERLFEATNATELDADRDAGGPRRLMRIALSNDEDIVCVSVNCPSTGRQFTLRVPPHIKTCHEAVAWTAGFDDPKLYKPAVET